MRIFVSLALVPALLAAGCQSAGVAVQSSDVAATQASALTRLDSLPTTHIGIDDDLTPAEIPNPFVDAMLAPVRGTGEVMEKVIELPVQTYQYATGDTPKKAALMLRDDSSPDTRRAGLNRLLEFPYTKRPPYTTAYQAMAAADPDPTVRAAALRACNRARDAKATSTFIQALVDASELVRLEACKALANLPDPAAAASLAKIAANSDESRDVRIAAADALKYYHTPDVVRVLSSVVGERDFSVAWQARRSLVYLTHKDFGYNESAWLSYFAGPGKSLASAPS